MNNIRIGIERNLELSAYTNFLFRYFPKERIFVGDGMFEEFFETDAELICLITSNENDNALFKDSLEVRGVSDDNKYEISMALAKEISIVFDTRTLCVSSKYFATETLILWHSGKSFIVKEFESSMCDLPPGGLRVVREIVFDNITFQPTQNPRC